MEQKTMKARGTASKGKDFVLPIPGGANLLNIKLSAACEYAITRIAEVGSDATPGKAAKAISIDQGYAEVQCLVVSVAPAEEAAVIDVEVLYLIPKN